MGISDDNIKQNIKSISYSEETEEVIGDKIAKEIKASYDNAVELIKKEKYLSAIPVLEKILDIKPDFAHAIYKLAFAKLKSDNTKEALKLCQNLIVIRDRKSVV